MDAFSSQDINKLYKKVLEDEYKDSTVIIKLEEEVKKYQLRKALGKMT